MQDYKPNSHKAKAETENAVAEKKVGKVISGNAKVRKKNGARKVADAFVSEDAGNVGSYILMDVIVPTLKDLLSDVVKNTIDTILYGGPSSGRSSSSRRRGGGYVEYNRFSDRRDDRRESRSVSVASRYSLDDIEFDSRGDADYALQQLDAIIDTYGMATVADLYDLVGLSSERQYTDQNYGWTSLGDARISRVRGGGYALEMPRVKSLK